MDTLIEDTFDYLIQLREIKSQIIKRNDEYDHSIFNNQLIEICSELFQKLGFPYFQYVVMTPILNANGKLGNAIFSHHMTNFPSEWTQQYANEALYEIDPISLELQEFSLKDNVEYFEYWHNVYQKYIDSSIRKEKIIRFIEDASSYNLADGIVYFKKSIHSSLLLTASANTPNVHNREKLCIILEIVSLSLIDTLGGDITTLISPNRPMKLTHKNKDILLFFYKNPNSSLKQAGKHFGISVDSLNEHLSKIRRITGMPGASAAHMALLLYNHIKVDFQKNRQ